MAITREQSNTLTAMGVGCKEIRQGLRKVQDQMNLYIARAYPTPTDEELTGAGFDYTSAEILAAVSSINALDDFFEDVAPVQGEHGKNIDIIRIG